MSHGSLARQDPLLHIKAEPRFFDDLLLKEDIQRDSVAVADRIRAVVAGYRRLAARRNRTRGVLLDLLGARDADVDVLMKSEPPAALVKDATWDATEVAQWIRHTLIAYPGILYDDLTAACFLGLAVDSFRSRSIASFFEGASYKGPFCEEESRWWKSRLLAKVTAYIMEIGEPGPPMSFGQLWKKKHRGRVALSRCCSSGEEPVDCVCYVRREPVRREHSLPYRPDSRPAVMDEARVSFKAIKSATKGFDPGLVSPEARTLAEEMQKRKS